jgi:hypothetical protein
MPSISLAINGIPLTITSREPAVIELFADYFKYYKPEFIPAEDRVDKNVVNTGIAIDLRMRSELPRREMLIPATAALFAQTGVVGLWRERSRERFYFDLSVAAFRVDVETGQIIGLVTPAAMTYPHILANTYTFFPLLLLLRARGFHHLHAAGVVSPDNRLWLICGAQRAGKTTLTTALGLAGWRPISDDSLLLSFDGTTARLNAFKKYFHLGNELLARWPQLGAMTSRHQYLDRTCVEGLEFFATREFAETKFERVDYIIIPQIVETPESHLAPIQKSEALLKLAEQSMFFQLWPEHTELQWRGLTQAAQTAKCYRLLAGADLLADPGRAAEVLTSIPRS